MRLAAAAGTTGLAAAMINPRQFWCGFPGCRKLHKIPQLGKLGKVIDHFERVHHPGLGDIICGTKDDKGNVHPSRCCLGGRRPTHRWREALPEVHLKPGAVVAAPSQGYYTYFRFFFSRLSWLPWPRPRAGRCQRRRALVGFGRV